ncbi:MAG: imidazole glycerol phosphate synthase subunit HisH [Gammaproteobacteria bacterium]|nr:imidazole glycerol phosphate synthase subunit HisH [Gammaproteobacteria bacterium]
MSTAVVSIAAAIVDYDAGNLRSVQRACHEVGLEAEIVGDPDLLRRADRVIFPGVGAAGAAMQSLSRRGLGAALKEIIARGTPTLGICLGLQISLQYSEENDTRTLGLFEGEVRRFQLTDRALKVPHMGWNEVRGIKPHPLLAGLEAGDEYYYVHAYFPAPADRNIVYAVSDYEQEFACALGRDNYFATQFHPEKSGRVGLRLLRAFAGWEGTC